MILQKSEIRHPDSILKNSDFLLRVLENIADGLVISDQKAILYINHSMSEMTGYTLEEVIGKPTTFFCPHAKPEETSARLKHIFEELEKKGRFQIYNDFYQTKDGRLLNVEINISILKDNEGKLLGSVAVIRDITWREKAEKELLKSEERFYNLVEMANDGIVMVDNDRKVILFNRKAEEIYGYSKEEIIGKEVSVLVPERHQKREKEWYDLLLTTGNSPVMNKSVELEGLRKDGTEIPLEYSFSMLRDEKGVLSIAVVRDIRERKRLEKEIIERERLSALMELAGATAHELNQPLTTILGATDLLLRKVSENDPYFKQLSLISKETQKLSNMIKKIRKVIRYETKPYLNNIKIIDLDKASREENL